MRAIMVMFDSLRKNYLPPYDKNDIVAPNFARLEKKCLTFDNFYVGSLPCMPARRELHSGRYGFLHRGWGPLEPYDDSMPELLDEAGVHTHLVSDHYHYWMDGGASYHPRYSSYENVRGQEGEKWAYELDALREPLVDFPGMWQPPEGSFFSKMQHRDVANRRRMPTEDGHYMTRTFDGGLDFLAVNKGAQDWFLQIESADPHEPFFTYEQYRALYPSKYQGRHVDWPSGALTGEGDPDYVEYVINQYKALLTMCDHNLGRVLDFMDENAMWEDTMLIVCADHGLMLSEHGWWGKGSMPCYSEIANTPFFLWDPRSGKKGERRKALCQTIDLAPTLLDFFGQPIPGDMTGKVLDQVAQNDAPVRDYALFGYFGSYVNITDGRYVYMRAPAPGQNTPLNEYTFLTGGVLGRTSTKHLQGIEPAGPFSFTKGIPVWQVDQSKIPAHGDPTKAGTLLFDLEADPSQANPLNDTKVEQDMLTALSRLMEEHDAPPEQWERLHMNRL